MLLLLNTWNFFCNWLFVSSVNDLVICKLPKWIVMVLENVQAAEVINECVIRHTLKLALNSFVISAFWFSFMFPKDRLKLLKSKMNYLNCVFAPRNELRGRDFFVLVVLRRRRLFSVGACLCIMQKFPYNWPSVRNEYVPLIWIEFFLGSKCTVIPSMSLIIYFFFLLFPVSCEVQAVLALGRVTQFTLFIS